MGVMFLGGFATDMTGTKASFLAEHCEKENISFLRGDYRGHGASSGEFRDGSIGAWLDDACALFDRQTDGPQLVIGSSMGGWLALMLAMARPGRVKALIGIAAAPDFTEELIWQNLSIEKRKILEQKGELEECGLIYTRRLIEEGRQRLILRGELAKLACPVRLLQGQNDESVPPEYAFRIADAIGHDDVRIAFIKNGDHRLSRDQDLAALWHLVGEFV